MIEGLQAALPWRPAVLSAIRRETPQVATLVFDVPEWPGHLAGQHIDIRLTAPDGYQAQRSYSIASAPASKAGVELTVERVEDGEVSPYLLDEAVVGDTLELRGPIGGYFTWAPGDGAPLLLIGGGSGVVPLMAILRQRAALGDATPARLLYSSRDFDGVIYREELEGLVAKNDGLEVVHTLTRRQPEGWSGERRRIDRAMIEAVGFPADRSPHAFVCGPTPLVEQVATTLVELGHSEARVKTERFGPSGDDR